MVAVIDPPACTERHTSDESPSGHALHPSIPNCCDHGDFQMPSGSKRGITVGAGQPETRVDPDEYASGVASPYERDDIDLIVSRLVTKVSLTFTLLCSFAGAGTSSPPILYALRYDCVVATHLLHLNAVSVEAIQSASLLTQPLRVCHPFIPPSHRTITTTPSRPPG